MGTTASHCESKKKQLGSDVSHFQHDFYIRILLFSFISPFFFYLSATLKCCFSLVNYSCLHIGAFRLGQEITSAVLANHTEFVAWTSVNNFKIAYTQVDLHCFSFKNISELFMFLLWEVQLIFSILINMSQVVNTEKGKLSEAELAHNAQSRTKQALGLHYCLQPNHPNLLWLRSQCSAMQGADTAQLRASTKASAWWKICQRLSVLETDLEQKTSATQPGFIVCRGLRRHTDTSRHSSVLHALTCCLGLEPSCQRCKISTASWRTYFIPRWLHQVGQHFDLPSLSHTRTLLLPTPWKSAGSYMGPHCCWPGGFPETRGVMWRAGLSCCLGRSSLTPSCPSSCTLSSCEHHGTSQQCCTSATQMWPCAASDPQGAGGHQKSTCLSSYPSLRLAVCPLRATGMSSPWSFCRELPSNEASWALSCSQQTPAE